VRFSRTFDRWGFAPLPSEEVLSLLVIGELSQSRASIDNPDAFVPGQIERVFVARDDRARAGCGGTVIDLSL